MAILQVAPPSVPKSQSSPGSSTPLPHVARPPPSRAVATAWLALSITPLYWLATSGASKQVAPASSALSIAFCHALLNAVSHLAIAVAYAVVSPFSANAFSAFCRHPK